MLPLIRPALADDAPHILALWELADAEPSRTDDVPSLRLLIGHDPGALIIAEADGQLVGSVIAGWDGWRGSIYRLVVAPAWRRRGLGRLLVAEAERRLADAGAARMQAIVVVNDGRAAGFWRSSGWQERPDQRRLTRSHPKRQAS